MDIGEMKDSYLLRVDVVCLEGNKDICFKMLYVP